MIVPSRSKKTAGEVPSAEPVILKTSQQFVFRDGSRSEFADDDGAAMIRVLGRFLRCRVTTKSKCEQCNRGVASARNIENLLRFCRNMMGRSSVLEEHHALFAKSDEDKPGFPFIEQGFPNLQQRFVFIRWLDRIIPWQTCS